MAKPPAFQARRSLIARLTGILDACRRMQQQFDKWEGIRRLDPDARIGDGAVQHRIAELQSDQIGGQLEIAKGEITTLEQKIAAADE